MSDGYEELGPGPAGLTMDIHIDALTTEDAFLDLAEDWNDVLQDSPARNIFLTWEWASSWWRSFGDGRRPYVLTARQGRNGRLLGIAPFAIARVPLFGVLPCRTLSLIGGGRAAADHLDVLIRRGHEPDVSEAFASHLTAPNPPWDLIRLESMAEDSATRHCLLARYPPRARCLWSAACPFLPLPGTWDDLRGSLGKKTRYNIGRCERLLEKAYPGRVVFRQVRNRSDVEAAMDTLFRLHHSVRQRTGTRSSFNTAIIAAFHRHVAARFLEQGWLRLYLLNVDGTDIAVNYNFRYNGVVSFFQGGYDTAPRWRQHSPGQRVMVHALRQAMAAGDHEFDFLRGEEEYKYLWTQRSRQGLFALLPTSHLGRLIVTFWRFAHAVHARIRPRTRATKRATSPVGTHTENGT